MFNLLGFGQAGLAQAKEPAEVSLDPASSWNLDATGSGCALRRAFGDPERPLILEMRRFAPGDRFDLVVSGDQMQGLLHGAIRVRYGELPPEPTDAFQNGTSERAGQKPVVTLFKSSSLAPKRDFSGETLVTPAMEEQAQTITIETANRRVILKTGSLGKPFVAMRQCTDALVASWGLDTTVQATLSRKAKPIGQAQWARAIQADYPRDLAAKGLQGRVNLRMLVGADGKPTGCKVLKSYNDPKFDTIACEKMMQNARFEPALDAAGNPVASYYATMITWSIN